MRRLATIGVGTLLAAAGFAHAQPAEEEDLPQPRRSFYLQATHSL